MLVIMFQFVRKNVVNHLFKLKEQMVFITILQSLSVQLISFMPVANICRQPPFKCQIKMAKLNETTEKTTKMSIY